VSAKPLPPSWRLFIWIVDLGAAPGAVLLGAHLVDQVWLGGSAHLVAPLALAIVALFLIIAPSTHPGPGRPWSPTLHGTLVVASATAVAASLTVGIGAMSWMAAAAATALAMPPAITTRLIVWLVQHSRPPRRLLLIGPQECRLRLREHLERHPELGCIIVGEFGPGCGARPLEELDAGVAECDPDEALISTGFDDRTLLTEAMDHLLDRPMIVRYVPDTEAVPLFCPRTADIAGLPAIDLSTGPLSPAAEVVKCVEDKVVSVIALILLALPMLAIAVAIKLSSPGPVFFVQARQGRYGRTIRVIKFRTMCAFASEQSITTNSFKQASKDDLRITPLGRFLRNTSLDELPQFFNVLRGDMSVVGPRPHVHALNKRFVADIGELMRRHYVKPGITGLAQISGSRGATKTVEEMRRRVNLDLEYLRRWSLWLDVTIIGKTMLFGWFNREP